MELRTHRNGGDAPLQSVAEAWMKEEHDFHWSEYPSDAHTVEMARRMKAAQFKAGHINPDPRNIH